VATTTNPQRRRRDDILRILANLKPYFNASDYHADAQAVVAAQAS
jgi:hypothetical protein